MDNRREALRKWSQQQLSNKLFDSERFGPYDSETALELETVSGDASFRRYFRFYLPNNADNTSIIAVDAPVEHENSPQFQLVSGLFQSVELVVPEVLAIDDQQGFMLLNDLGDHLFLSRLEGLKPDSPDFRALYRSAMKELLPLAGFDCQAWKLPPYNKATLLREMSLFQEWFLKKYLHVSLSGREQNILNESLSYISEKILEQPLACVHRDYHSRNILIQDDGRLGMIDFQDALIGPVTYDPVSLLKDCYIELKQELVDDLLQKHHRDLEEKELFLKPYSFEMFKNDFDLMGIQRHLKVLGVFARLSMRDGKHDYLNDLPLTFNYVKEALPNFQALQAFSNLFSGKIQEAFYEKRKASLN